jgi:hypothetical protein
MQNFFSKPGWAPKFMSDTYKPGYELGSAFIEKGRLLKDSGKVLADAHQKAIESLVPTVKSTASNLQGVAGAMRTIPRMMNYIFITSVTASALVILGGLVLVAAMRAMTHLVAQEASTTRESCDTKENK